MSEVEACVKTKSIIRYVTCLNGMVVAAVKNQRVLVLKINSTEIEMEHYGIF